MSCARHEPSILLHAHGELGWARRLLVERHLKRCDGCRAKWSRWHMRGDAARQVLAAPPGLRGGSERFVTAVAERIRAEPQTAPELALDGAPLLLGPRRRAGVFLLAAALLLLTLCALAAFWHRRPAVSGAASGRPASGATGAAKPADPKDCDLPPPPVLTPAAPDALRQSQSKTPIGDPGKTQDGR